jgi:RHS repeat-associated protein
VQYNTSGLPTVLNWGIGQGQVRHTKFAYDPDGDRVLKRDGDQTTITVGGLFERRTPAGTGSNETHNLHNIVVDGRVVAQINRSQAASGALNPLSGVTYLHNDLQDSTVALTNRNGEPAGDDGSWLREIFYDPFGRRIDAQNDPLNDSRRGGPRQGYTGHEHDDEFGLINMQGRIYDPEARRFLTPDPIQPPVSSQTYNRYSYVQNNPATLTDPTGYLPPQTDLPSGPALPRPGWREPGYEVCFNVMTQDLCRADPPVEADPFRESDLALRVKSARLRAGLSATPTATPAAPTPSADDRARPTVKVSEQSAVFRGAAGATTTGKIGWILRKLRGALAGALLGGDVVEEDPQLRPKVPVVEERVRPPGPTRRGLDPSKGQGGFVKISVLGKIAIAAAVAIAAVTIYQGCTSGSCARGVADAYLTAAGAPVTYTEATELWRTPEGRAELLEVTMGTYLDKRGQGARGGGSTSAPPSATDS